MNAQNATLELQGGTLTDGTSPDVVGNLDLSNGESERVRRG